MADSTQCIIPPKTAFMARAIADTLQQLAGGGSKYSSSMSPQVQARRQTAGSPQAPQHAVLQASQASPQQQVVHQASRDPQRAVLQASQASPKAVRQQAPQQTVLHASQASPHQQSVHQALHDPQRATGITGFSTGSASALITGFSAGSVSGLPSPAFKSFRVRKFLLSLFELLPKASQEAGSSSVALGAYCKGGKEGGWEATKQFP